MKPYAEACEQNKEPILALLREVLADARTVLEIGSGTGQHAVHFGRALPHLTWITSDLPAHHAGIRAWVEEAGLPNVLAPLALDVAQQPWPVPPVDAVFSANTAHIMAWPQVERLFAGVGRVLVPGGVFCLYGPFSYGGRHTAESNARFDRWLRLRDAASGVRDFEALDRLATAAGLALLHDQEMPVNNRTLVWRREAP
jgi:cyclopropane fatty-acyl-phospholipid synthase-like methyltransferase